MGISYIMDELYGIASLIDTINIIVIKMLLNSNCTTNEFLSSALKHTSSMKSISLASFLLDLLGPNMDKETAQQLFCDLTINKLSYCFR